MHESNLLHVLHQCAAMCEHTMSVIIQSNQTQFRAQQLLLLRDCADICHWTAKYVSRMSPFARHMAHVCAMVCEACGRECLRFPDPISQECGQMCLHCAHECRRFSMH